MSSLQSKHTDSRVRLLEGYPTLVDVREYLAKSFDSPLLLKDHLDLWIAEPDLKSGTYSIDFIRQLLSFGALTPHELPYKIIVFTKAHLLGELGMNALLKILEEPPPHLYFVLTAPQRFLLIDTLCSRISHIESFKNGVDDLKETSPEKKLYHFIQEDKMSDWSECLGIAEYLSEEAIGWENFFCLSWQLLFEMGIPPSVQLSWQEELKQGKKIYIKERNLILALLIKIRSFTHDQKQKEELILSIMGTL